MADAGIGLALRLATKVNEKIRLVALHGEELYPIFFFQVKQDGSIYMGPRYERIAQLRIAEPRAEETTTGHRVHVKYGEGRPITNDALMRGFKVSYHGSGFIHVGDERLKAEALRGLQTQLLMCVVFFEHPRNFGPIQQLRAKAGAKDVPIPLPIIENWPIWARVHVAPTSMQQVVDVQGVSVLSSLQFSYTGLSHNVPDITVNVVFSLGLAGPWPSETMMLVRGDKVPRQT